MSNTTSRLSLSQPVGTDNPSALRLSITANANILDAALMYGSGTLAARPLANSKPNGYVYLATDDTSNGVHGTYYVGDGTNWNTLRVGEFLAGTLSSRPAAGAFVQGGIYLATDDFTGGPAGTYYITSGSQWTALGVGPRAYFGDGADGALTLTTDGSGVPANFTNGTLATRASAVYTLAGDIYCSSLTINPSVTLSTAGFKVFVSGTLTVSGTLSNDGHAATSSAGATSGMGTLGATFTGASAGTGGGFSFHALGSATGGIGGAGGSGSSGAGGSTAIDLPYTFPYGVPTAAGAPRYGFPRTLAVLSTPVFAKVDGSITGLPPAMCGASGGGDGTNAGGGGGGGGGILIGAAATLAGGGTISARGGSGFSPTAGNTGGGGGGGGGIVYLVAGANTFTGTLTAAGGSGGSGHGTGTAGTTGGTGLAEIISG
jgi:hypothetical protein